MRHPFPAFLLLCLTPIAAQAAPADYRFVSVYTETTPINAFTVYGGAINNNGSIAVGLPTGFNEGALYRIDGPVWTLLYQTAPGGGGLSRFDINDVGQVAGVLETGGGGSPRKLMRLETDGSITTLLTTVELDPQDGDYCGLGFLGNGLNNAGQVVIEACRVEGSEEVSRIYVFGDDPPVEIVQWDNVTPGGLWNFTPPSINSAGIVAFGATEVDNCCMHVYSTMSGGVTEAGTPPAPQGGQVLDTLINDQNVIGTNAFAGIHTIDNGVITTEVAAEAGVGQARDFSFNNEGQFAFLGCLGLVCGIFTGDDPEADAVLRNGDAVFGGNVTGGNELAFRFDDKNINDDGEIAFRVQVSVDGTTVSHLVRAIPLSPLVDSDDDGVANDVDNCLTADNDSQLDSDGDGYGNHCDPDLDNDGVVSFGDLGELRKVFFSADADADLNGDGVVNFADLGLMKAMFFGVPGPSAVAP